MNMNDECAACDSNVSANLPVHTWVIIAVIGVIIIMSVVKGGETAQDKLNKATGYAQDVKIQDRRFKNRITCKIKLLFLCTCLV